MTAHAIRRLIKNGEVVRAKRELDLKVWIQLIDCDPDLAQLLEDVHDEIRSAYSGLSGIKEG